MVKNEFRSQTTWVQNLAYHLLAGWPWEKYFTPTSFPCMWNNDSNYIALQETNDKTVPSS